MDENTVIKVEKVSKDFNYTSRKSITVKSLFTGALKKQLKDQEKTQHALKDLSFEVKKGEFFGIVGRNGSGKSTLLKMLAGIYQPTSGNISVQGKLVPFIELGVGFNPELTGRENVYMNGALLNFSEKEVDKFYDEVAEFAELEKFMDKKLKNYSSGMQVRLAFSMAIRAKADILLIDEVLAVGDADFQRKCFSYFRRLKRDLKTVVFVSHDMEAIRQYCDRAILIEDSRLVASGSAEKIAQAYIKQFNRQQNEIEVEADTSVDGKRWGDGAATISAVSLKVAEDQIFIDQTIYVNKALEGCIAGIRIKALTGEHITGTNTKLEHIALKNLGIDKKIKLKWSLPNIFSDGKYLIDAAVTHMDEITVCDWWDDAKQFTIRKERALPYAIDPGFKVDLE